MCSPIDQSKVAKVGRVILPNMAAKVPLAVTMGMAIRKREIPNEYLAQHCLMASHPFNTHGMTTYHVPDMKVGLYLRGFSNFLDFSWFSSPHFPGGTFVFSVTSPASGFPWRGCRLICFIFCCTSYEERLDQENLLNNT